MYAHQLTRDLERIYGPDGTRERFQSLCTQLIISQHPLAKAIRVHPGDGGVDVYLGDWSDPEGIHVFQVKYFPDAFKPAQKEQIRRSFRICVSNANFTTSKWTLCIPRDLDTDETTWFTRWKQKVASERLPIAAIDYWGEATLLHLLNQPKNRDLREAIFKDDQAQRIRETHTLVQALPQQVAQTLRSPEQAALALRLTTYVKSEPGHH